jgi:valyl-tRNA synthetase
LPLEGVIDFDQETARLTKEIDKMVKELRKFDAKLSNEKFLAKAPEDVVAEQRVRKADAEEARTKLEEALARLQGAA